MALNDIVVAREVAGGSLAEVALAAFPPSAHAASHGPSGSDPLARAFRVAVSSGSFSGTLLYTGESNGKPSWAESGQDSITLSWNGTKWRLFAGVANYTYYESTDANIFSANWTIVSGQGNSPAPTLTFDFVRLGDFAAPVHTHSYTAITDLVDWANDNLADVAVSGSYNDLLDAPALGTAAAEDSTAFAAASHTHAASDITSGTIDTARLASGTANSGTFLRGDQTWAAVSGGSKTYAVFTAEHNQPPSTAFATLDTRNSIAVLDFDAATDENAVFVGIMPEAASLGSGLIVRLNWMATSATSGNVRWGVQFERSNTDLDSDSFDTAVEATAATNGTSGIITTTAITVTTIDGITAGDVFRLKVFRNADDATNDTMTGDAELVAVEVRSAA